MAEGHQSSSSQAADAKSATQRTANLRGIFLICGAMAAFVLNDTLTKTTSTELPTGQIIAIRGLFASLLMAPIVGFTVGFSVVGRSYSPALLVRNVSEVASVFLFLNALFRLPLANVTAILQTLPLTLTAAAAIFLNEQVGWRRWLAAAVGLIGIALVVRPGTAEFSWWYLAALACVITVTVRHIATRFIDKRTPTIAVTFLTALIVMLAGIVFGTTESWVVPSLPNLIRLAAAAVFVLCGYYALIECWRDTEISVIAPFRYSVVIWALLFGYLFLGEIPSAWTLAGSAIVASAGLYTFHREQRANNR